MTYCTYLLSITPGIGVDFPKLPIRRVLCDLSQSNFSDATGLKMYIRGLQIREGGNGENWEGPQFDPVVRPVEPESLSSLGAREHLPIEARKKACFMLWF